MKVSHFFLCSYFVISLILLFSRYLIANNIRGATDLWCFALLFALLPLFSHFFLCSCFVISLIHFFSRNLIANNMRGPTSLCTLLFYSYFFFCSYFCNAFLSFKGSFLFTLLPLFSHFFLYSCFLISLIHFFSKNLIVNNMRRATSLWHFALLFLFLLLLLLL